MDREKLLQLELRLKGRAEQVFIVMLKDSVCDFHTAVDSLRKRLAPIRREALLSAQLIKRKQKPAESVNQYAQDFETLLDRSYGRRSGMDQEPKDLLKRDLFVLGLTMKWQEKELPSTKDFGDCFHQTRAAEEHERQLNEIHRTQSTDQPRSSESITRIPRETSRPRSTEHLSSSRRNQQCGKCGSTHRRQRDCQQEHPPSESTGATLIVA